MKTFTHKNIGDFLDDYSEALVTALNQVDKRNLDKASRVIEIARATRLRIFSAGNGGSSSIAEHLECDFQKGCHKGHKPAMLTKCLNSNPSLLTAIANDMGYERIFSYRLELENPRDGEILILISSSGNSPNIVEALKTAKQKKMITIGLSGFSGGILRKESDISLHVPIENYGIVEDCHQALMHVIAQHHAANI